MPDVSLKNKIGRRARIALACVGVLALLILALHIWFVNNARGILKNIVEEKSKGAIKLELSQVHFNFFNNRLSIEEGDLNSTDSLTVLNSYRVTFSSLTLKVRSFWPLLLHKDLMLDSIRIENPLIEINKWRKDTTSINQEDLSVAEQMGRVYNSMLDVLKDFGIRRIVVNNASLKLQNKMKKDAYPVWITNINLNVLRNPQNNSKTILSEEAVNLTSNSQTIGLPDGRHHLSFKNFRLQLFQKRIDLDSCTVTAVPKGTSTSTYRIFFKKLALVGVDFDAMGKLNLIKADSVYCENPSFNFTIVPSSSIVKKDRPDPTKLIRELTSDLDLAYVGVKNAGINLSMLGDRPRSIFNSGKDNFEMKGLKIKSDSSAPVSVEKFDMLVRDYQLYNIDSSAIFSFDSIHFINKKILLNNFSVITTPSRYKLKSIRHFRFPQFELTGLDWYELIFNQNVVAKEAVLINPVISYTKRTPAKENNTNFFAQLQNMDSLMTLERLTILNGTLNLNFGKSTSVAMEQVNLKISSNKFMSATNQDGLRRAVDYFSMSKGVLHRKDLTGTLMNVKYLPNNIINADQLLLSSSSGNVNALITGVLIDNMLLDDRTETIFADGLQWNNATVRLNTLPGKKQDRNSREGSFNVSNILGKNTKLILSNGITTINSSVQFMQLDSLVKINNGAALAAGVHFAGNVLKLENDRTHVNALVDEININSMMLQDEAKDIKASGITWNNATLDVVASPNNEAGKANEGILEFKDIWGRNTVVKMVTNGKYLNTNIDEIKAASILKKGNLPFTTTSLLVAGNTFQVKDSSLQASIDLFRVQDGSASWFKNLQYKKLKGVSSGTLSAPEVNFEADLNSFFAGQYNLQNVSITKPDIAIINRSKTKTETDTLSSHNSQGSPHLTIDRVTIIEPDFIMTKTKNDSITTIKIPRSANSLASVGNLTMDSAGLSIKSVNLHTSTASIRKAEKTMLSVTDGAIDINLFNLSISDNKEKGWTASINSFAVVKPDTFLLGKQEDQFALEQLLVTNVQLTSQSLQHLPLFLSQNNTAQISLVNGQFKTTRDVFRWSDAVYDQALKTFQLDSFVYQPLHTLAFEMNNAPYEKDYTTFNTVRAKLVGFDWETFRTTKGIVAKTIELDQPSLKIYRDKLPPNEPNELKPLPTKAIQNSKSLLDIGQIIIKDGTVSYTEKHEKSRQEGTLVMTRLNGSVINIKNNGLTTKDSLVANVQAYLMGQAPLNLSIAQAYIDTAYSFTMKLRLQPTPLSILNPVMVPLSNVKFVGGYIDSFQINATAREHFAVGNMNMFYHGLKVRLVKDGNPNQYGLKNNVVSFIANTFIIKNNNDKDAAQFYLERMRDKSFFNYLLKITFKGMGTSIGAGSNRKNIKAYHNKLKGTNLPPVFFQSASNPTP